LARLGEARALLTEGRNPEAEQVLRQALVADPRNAMAYDLLGGLLSEVGRFDEARACFERAIALAPLLAGSYYDLVRCRPVTSDDGGQDDPPSGPVTPNAPLQQVIGRRWTADRQKHLWRNARASTSGEKRIGYWTCRHAVNSLQVPLV